MNKKHLIMILTMFLIGPLLVPQVYAQNVTSESILDEIRLIHFETETTLTFDGKTIPTNSLGPGAEVKNIKATVEFKFNLPSLFPKFLVGTKIGKWIMFRDINFDEPVNISLSLVEKPKWCDITLPEQVLIEDIGTEFKSSEFVFSITVNKTALAFEKGDIKIKAEFKPKTSWGLLESSGEDKFTINTTYIGKLQAYFNLSENTTVIRFDNGETKTIPLFIQNDYNSKVIVSIEPLISDSNWNINITQTNITLGPGENTKVNVSITTKKLDNLMDSHLEYTGDIIRLTPKFTKDTTINLGNIIISDPNLDIKIDGYLLDILLIIFAIIAIVIIVVVIIFVLRKRNR